MAPLPPPNLDVMVDRLIANGMDRNEAFACAFKQLALTSPTKRLRDRCLMRAKALRSENPWLEMARLQNEEHLQRAARRWWNPWTWRIGHDRPED